MAKFKDPKKAAPKAEKAPTTEKPVEKPEATKVEPKKPKPSRVSGPGGGFGVPSAEPMTKPEERKIQLKNLRRRSWDITLEHEVYCQAIGRCVCSKRVVGRWERVERGSKEQALREKEIRMPKSFILAPMATSEVLNDAARLCADVKNHLNCKPQHIKILPA